MMGGNNVWRVQKGGGGAWSGVGGMFSPWGRRPTHDEKLSRYFCYADFVDRGTPSPVERDRGRVRARDVVTQYGMQMEVIADTILSDVTVLWRGPGDSSDKVGLKFGYKFEWLSPSGYTAEITSMDDGGWADMWRMWEDHVYG